MYLNQHVITLKFGVHIFFLYKIKRNNIVPLKINKYHNIWIINDYIFFLSHSAVLCSLFIHIFINNVYLHTYFL